MNHILVKGLVTTNHRGVCKFPPTSFSWKDVHQTFPTNPYLNVSLEKMFLTFPRNFFGENFKETKQCGDFNFTQFERSLFKKQNPPTLFLQPIHLIIQGCLCRAISEQPYDQIQQFIFQKYSPDFKGIKPNFSSIG